MRLVLPGDPQAQLRRAPSNGKACLALFAAVDALQLGFVAGVPPYVYVERLQPASLAAWKNLRACGPGEPPISLSGRRRRHSSLTACGCPPVGRGNNAVVRLVRRRYGPPRGE